MPWKGRRFADRLLGKVGKGVVSIAQSHAEAPHLLGAGERGRRDGRAAEELETRPHLGRRRKRKIPAQACGGRGDWRPGNALTPPAALRGLCGPAADPAEPAGRTGSRTEFPPSRRSADSRRGNAPRGPAPLQIWCVETPGGIGHSPRPWHAKSDSEVLGPVGTTRRKGSPFLSCVTLYLDGSWEKETFLASRHCDLGVSLSQKLVSRHNLASVEKARGSRWSRGTEAPSGPDAWPRVSLKHPRFVVWR